MKMQEQEVGSDLIVLQKQSGKGIATSDEEKFVQTIAVPKGDGFSMAFTHSAIFEAVGKTSNRIPLPLLEPWEQTLMANPRGSINLRAEFKKWLTVCVSNSHTI